MGSQEVRDLWKELAPEGSAFCNAYLTKLAIETNHVESTFVLTEEVHFLLFIDLSPFHRSLHFFSQFKTWFGVEFPKA